MTGTSKTLLNPLPMTTIIDFQYHREVWRCYKAVMSCYLEVNSQGYDSKVALTLIFTFWFEFF